jgi:hypothetical protein
MEQQLEDQRILARLASRIDLALRELQRGIDNVSEHARTIASSAGDAGDEEGTRKAMLAMLARLAADAGQQRVEVRQGLASLQEQLDLTGLRAEVAELATRIERGMTPLPGAHREVRDALAELAARVERGTEPQAEILSWLASLADQLDARTAAEQSEAARALASAQRALSEQAVRLETLQGTLQSQASHAGDRVAALLDQVVASQREFLATLGSASTQIVAEASFTRETVKGESEHLRACLAEAIAAAKAGLDQSVGTARAVSDQIATGGVASRAVVERMQSMMEALVARFEDVQAQGARRLDEASDALEQSARGLEPSVVTAVENLHQALLGIAANERAESNAMVATLREAATGAVGELRSIVDDVGQRMLDAQSSGTAELQEATASLARAVDDLQPTFSSALARLYGAVAAAATQVEATSEKAAERAQALLAESLQGIEATISEQLVETGVVSKAAARTLVGAHAQAASRLERAAEMLEQQGAALQPALAGTIDELQRSLSETSAAVSAAVSVADQAAARRGGEVKILVDAAGHLTRTAEALTPAVTAALARIDGTVAEAVALVESAFGERLAQSEAAAGAVASDLLAASSDAQDGLRVWLSGALPDAVTQLTAGLGRQLERLEARVDQSAARMQSVWEATCDEAGDAMASAAVTRMAEAASALTAAAEDRVEAAERRFSALTERIGALVGRLEDVAGDAPLRTAGDPAGAPGQLVLAPAAGAERALVLATERFEAVLAELRDFPGRAAPAVRGSYSPELASARDVDTVALQLEETLARAEDLERRLEEGIEDAVQRLDAACGSFARLESQMIGYLRERDRMIAAEREWLISELVERLGSAAGRKDSGRLLGGLRSVSSRRRDSEPPPISSPARPQQAVRPPAQAIPTDASGRARGNSLMGGGTPPPRRLGAPGPLPSCDVCGFIAKSPGGLAAHRRTHE